MLKVSGETALNLFTFVKLECLIVHVSRTIGTLHRDLFWFNVDKRCGTSGTPCIIRRCRGKNIIYNVYITFYTGCPVMNGTIEKEVTLYVKISHKCKLNVFF